MKKFAEQIEQNMEFILGGKVISSVDRDDAIAYLKKAHDLLENAGYTEASDTINQIMVKAAEEDDSTIEVTE